jgi:3-oxoacyl-[acyl-carrier-protein] synthase II
MADARETWITGIGIVSCLGEGPDAHWQGLRQAHANVDTTSYAPYLVHQVGAVEFDRQIPKKGDQRQMEQWQRLGTYAAGLALDSAGIKGNAEVLARTDMIVAAGGGERDLAVDSAILAALPNAEDREAYLNERLMSDLRPTLFLAQLSNLLAGNISLVHGVTGSSRTFMGEEMAGVDAVRIALSRIAAGQSDIALVGGSYNADRPDIVMLYAAGGHLTKGRPTGIWERAAAPGMALGSMGAFLVLEERGHAAARNATPLARLSKVVSDSARRDDGSVATSLERLWRSIGCDAGATAVISGATGTEPATAEERAFLARHPFQAVRATGGMLGHGLEPHFPMNIALASLALTRQRIFPPHDGSGFERSADMQVDRVLVTGIGHWRGEGLALVEAVR